MKQNGRSVKSSYKKKPPNNQTPKTKRQIATAYFTGENFSRLNRPNMQAKNIK